MSPQTPDAISQVAAEKSAPVESKPKTSPASQTGKPAGLSPLEAARLEQKKRVAAGDGPVHLKPKRSQLAKSLMHLTRRGHLYAGLLLLPWVFLYGITGFLFNHPEIWPDQQSVAIQKSHTAGTTIESLPKAPELAAQVVALLNARGGDQYTLLDPEKIVFPRGGYSATITSADKKQFSVFLLSNGTGTIRGVPARTAAAAAPATPAPGGRGPENSSVTTAAPKTTGSDAEKPAAGAAAATEQDAASPPGEGGRRRGRGGPRGEGSPEGEGRPEGPRPGFGGGRGEGPRGGRESSGPPAPFAVASGLLPEKSPMQMINDALPEVLKRVEMDGAVITAVRVSPLSFFIEGGGKKWNVTYNGETGSVSGTEFVQQEAEPAMSLRRFLLRLHMSHGYPGEDMNMRWLWAVLVDATSLIMVFWGISGVIMWWQIKRTRLLGGACLLFSTVAATYIGIGMQELIMAAGR